MRVWVPVSKWQVLKSLPLLPVLLADKEGEPVSTDEVLDETVPEYQAPGKKSMLAIWQLDPEDVSLVKYKQALLGPLPPVVGMAWGLDVGGSQAGGGRRWGQQDTLWMLFLLRPQPAQCAGDQADAAV